MKCTNRKQNFTLANKVECSVDLTDGQMTANFFDASTGGSMLPVNVSHVFRKSSENENQEYNCGKDFRLNLHQKLKNIGTDEAEFVDESGERHKFKDTYYYIDETGVKNDVVVDAVQVGLDGKLFYQSGNIKYDIKKEQHTCSGLMLTGELVGIKGAELLEQRHEEQVRLEDAVEAYENKLKEYVRVQEQSGTIISKMKDQFDGKELTKAKFDAVVCKQY